MYIGFPARLTATIKGGRNVFVPQKFTEMSLSNVECWRAATTLAQWCDALDPETTDFVSALCEDWKVPIPDNLRDMKALQKLETWRILEEEYKVFRRSNYQANRLINLAIELRMDGVIAGPDSPGGDKIDFSGAATKIAEWCLGSGDAPEPENLWDVLALRFQSTWNALERDHKIFRFRNYKTDRLLHLSIQLRMDGGLV